MWRSATQVWGWTVGTGVPGRGIRSAPGFSLRTSRDRWPRAPTFESLKPALGRGVISCGAGHQDQHAGSHEQGDRERDRGRYRDDCCDRRRRFPRRPGKPDRRAIFRRVVLLIAMPSAS